MTTAAQDQAELERRQDELRPVRQFLSLVSGISGDQSYSGTDSMGVNAPGQFSTYGPYGQAVEGQPLMTYNSAAGMTLSPMVLLAGAAVVAYLLMR